MYVDVRAQTTQLKYRLMLRCKLWTIVRLKLGNGCSATNHPQGHRFYLNKTIKSGVRPANVGPRESVKTWSSLLCWKRSDDETHLICSCIYRLNLVLIQQFLLGPIATIAFVCGEGSQNVTSTVHPIIIIIIICVSGDYSGDFVEVFYGSSLAVCTPAVWWRKESFALEISPS